MGTKSAWTSERRARQSEVIRQIRPWEQSTGPTSEAGKAKSALNAYAGDWYHEAMKTLAEARSKGLELLG